MGRWLYFKYGKFPQSDHISCEQVRDELPLGLAKTLTRNVHLITGYSWAFGSGLRAASVAHARIY